MFSQDVAVSALAFISNIFLARWLGPVQLGLFYMLALLPSYSEKFGRLGVVDHAAIYFVGKGRYSKEMVGGHLTLITLALSLLPVLLYVLLQNVFRVHFLKGQQVPNLYIWTMVASIPFMFLFISLNKMLVIVDRIAQYGMLQVSKSLIFILLVVFFWWRKWDFYGCCLATLISIATVAIANYVLLQKECPFQYRFHKQLVQDLFGYGWKMYVISMLLFLHQRLDLLLVSWKLSPAEVSYYAMAVAASQMLWKIPNATSGILYARVSTESQQNAFALTARSCRHAFTMLVLSSLGIMMIGWPFVKYIYGERYMPMVWPMFAILPGIVTMGVARILQDYFYGAGNPRIVFVGNLICTPINAGLNLILIPKFGILAAALISSVTYTIYFLILTNVFVRRSGGSWNQLMWMDRMDLERVLQLVKLESFNAIP